MKGKKQSEWRTQRQLSKKELQLRVGSRRNGPQGGGGNGAQLHTSSTTTYPFVTSPKWFSGFFCLVERNLSNVKEEMKDIPFIIGSF